MENARNFVLDNAEISFTDYNEMRAFVEEREKNTEWLEQGVRELVFGALHEEPLCAPVYAEKMHVSQEAIEDTMAGAGLKLTVSSGTRPVGASAVASIINRAGLQAAGWKKLRNGNLESLKSVLNMLMDVSSGAVDVYKRQVISFMQGSRCKNEFFKTPKRIDDTTWSGYKTVVYRYRNSFG